MVLFKKREYDVRDIEMLRTCHNQIMRLSLSPEKDLQVNEQNTTGLNLTFNELASPIPFCFYDYISIEDFSWRRGEKNLSLEIYLSFLEEKTSVDLAANLVNSRTGKSYGTFTLQSVTMVEKFTSSNFFSLPENLSAAEIDALSVIVDCQVIDLFGRPAHLQMLSDINIKSAITELYQEELAPVYTHIYPKKEDVTIIFGKDKGYELPVTYQHDPNNIVISLRRVPEQAGDSDYVCNYDSEHGPIEYYPILAIPAKGIIRLGRSVNINSVCNKKALIEKISSGGVAPITTTGFTPEVIENGSLQYALNTDWGFRLRQEGNLTPQTYNFTLSFDIKYQLPAGKEQTLSFKVSSKVNEKIRTGEVIQEPVLPLKIMWGCLSSNTFITMADGQQKKINDIQCGDKIISGLANETATVSNIWRGPEANLLFIYAENGDILEATSEHPVYVKTESGFKIKRAKDITINENLLFLKNGNIENSRVINIAVTPYNDLVYNLSLENSNSFYANGFLVGDMGEQNREDL